MDPNVTSRLSAQASSPGPKGFALTSIVGPDLAGIPYTALVALGKVIAEGAARYGDLNWLKGLNDPGFRRERRKHALLHFAAWNHLQEFGTLPPEATNEDHLAKVFWFCMIELHFQELQKAALERDEDQCQTQAKPLKDPQESLSQGSITRYAPSPQQLEELEKAKAQARQSSLESLLRTKL